MKTYKVKVEQGADGWLVATGVSLRGLVTQGRDMADLAFMVRDAIEQLTERSDFAIELLVPPSVHMDSQRVSATSRKRRRKAA